MASIQGLVSSYDFTVGLKLDISNLIDQLDPYDVPLLGTYGADGSAMLTRDTCFAKKREWLDDVILTPRTTLSGAVTTGTTAFLIQTADANHFGVGDVLRIDAEHVRVTVLSTDGVTLTVTRAFAGTAVNHADLAVVVGVGTALAEGSDPGVARSVDRTNRYNITQIFGPHAVKLSATENVVAKYGLTTSEFDYQVGQRTKEVGISLESAILYGALVDDTGNEWRTMNGMLAHIATNVDSSTTTLTDTKLVDIQQVSYGYGGAVDTVLVGPKQKRVISSFENVGIGAGTTSPLRRMASDRSRGTVVSTYESDFGVLNVLLDRWVRVNDLFGYNRDQVTLYTLNQRQLQFEMLAKTGDSMHGQIVAEHTLEFRRQKHAFRFSALT